MSYARDCVLAINFTITSTMTSKHYHRRKQPDEPVRNKYQKKKRKRNRYTKTVGRLQHMQYMGNWNVKNRKIQKGTEEIFESRNGIFPNLILDTKPQVTELRQQAGTLLSNRNNKQMTLRYIILKCQEITDKNNLKEARKGGKF